MEEKEMSFLDHIGELRGHLIRSVLSIILMAILIGVNIDWVVKNILFYPTKPDFPTFKLINNFSQYLVGENSISLPEKFPIQVRKLYEQLNASISISIFGGMLLSFPYIVWETWRFISPALLPNEKKYSLIIINGTWIFFFLGALVGYFIILPFAINFGYFYRISDDIILNYDLSDYLSLFLQIVFGMALVFLFPMIIYILTSLGSISPNFMKNYRKHAIVIIFIISAIITPADVISMLIASIPLLILYELSIYISKITYNRLHSQYH